MPEDNLRERHAQRDDSAYPFRMPEAIFLHHQIGFEGAWRVNFLMANDSLLAYNPANLSGLPSYLWPVAVSSLVQVRQDDPIDAGIAVEVSRSSLR
jgi:hypothetical protein